MSDDRRQRLVNLGAESLADALLEIANWDEQAEELLERMTSTQKENFIRFKEKLANISKRHKFVSQSSSRSIARRLESMLEDLKSGVEDPKAGLESMVEFFRADKTVFENSDDSSGHIGLVFTFNARNLFISYASRSDDKSWIADVVIDLIRQDNYGVRSSLIDCAAEYLPATEIRLMTDRLWKISDEKTELYERRRRYRTIESLARQINDAVLFEKARLASDPGVSDKSLIDIARVYQESGDAAAALAWMNRIGDAACLEFHDGNSLLLDIHRKLDNPEETRKILWKIFRKYRSAQTLGELLDEIGHERRDAVVDVEARTILDANRFSYADIRFLIEVGRVDEAESCLMKWRERIDGEMYYAILPVAQKLHKEGRCFTATLLYRTLLDSILERAHWKAYRHGREYLGVLIDLAQSITDWRDLPSHEQYTNRLLANHSRKRSFWQCSLN